jgi:NADH:ubiquinone oxidoreductase subunit D
MARSVGFKKDVRLSNLNSYSNYNNFFFKSYVGSNGDCFDRYLIRMLEMGESLHLINLILNKMHTTNLTNYSTNVLWNSIFGSISTNVAYTSMEDLISHFLN